MEKGIDYIPDLKLPEESRRGSERGTESTEAMAMDSEYVDKTGLIALVNKSVGTMGKLTCISRPRRFGKSYAAKMLCAYYDCSCDSHALFDDKEVARTEGYLAHLNQYHVISIDVSSFLSMAQRKGILLKDVPNIIADAVQAEVGELYSTCVKGDSLTDSLVRCVERTGRRFVFIIDEWDALIREAKEDSVAQKRYLNLLREWFKNNNFTPQVVELKWNKSAEGAVRQIKEHHYPAVLMDYGGEVVIVGINYDAKTKEHSCVIERV